MSSCILVPEESRSLMILIDGLSLHHQVMNGQGVIQCVLHDVFSWSNFSLDSGQRLFVVALAASL